MSLNLVVSNEQWELAIGFTLLHNCSYWNLSFAFFSVFFLSESLCNLFYQHHQPRNFPAMVTNNLACLQLSEHCTQAVAVGCLGCASQHLSVSWKLEAVTSMSQETKELVFLTM